MRVLISILYSFDVVIHRYTSEKGTDVYLGHPDLLAPNLEQVPERFVYLVDELARVGNDEGLVGQVFSVGLGDQFF